MQNTGKLLKNRTLVTIGVAESISGIGDWITMMAIFAILVFRGTGGVAESSGIFMAGLLPALPASLAAGWLCDRYDRKILMIGSLLVSGLVVSGLIFTENIVLIYALVALQAVSVAIMTPARQAAMPDIVPLEELTHANALLQQLSGIIKIGAPMIAGAVLAVLNPHQAIILDVISFALAAVMLFSLPSLPPHREENSADKMKSETVRTSPLQVLKELPVLRLAFLSIFLAILVIVGFDVTSSVFTRDVLLADERFFGLLIGMVGVGTLIATIWLLLRKNDSDPWPDVIKGLGLLAVIPLLLSFLGMITQPVIQHGIALLGCLIGGIGNGLLHVQSTTLIQRSTPPQMLGRMGGMFQSTAVAGQIAGIVITPLLIPAVLSMSVYYTISFICLATLVLFLVLQLKVNRRTLKIQRELTQ